MSFKTISGEVNLVKEQMIAPCLETTLPTIPSILISRHFNADKLSLFAQKEFTFEKMKISLEASKAS